MQSTKINKKIQKTKISRISKVKHRSWLNKKCITISEGIKLDKTEIFKKPNRRERNSMWRKYLEAK